MRRKTVLILMLVLIFGVMTAACGKKDDAISKAENRKGAGPASPRLRRSRRKDSSMVCRS